MQTHYSPLRRVRIKEHTRRIWRSTIPKHGICLITTIGHFGATLTVLKNRIHAIAPQLQFWGYEGGNVLAAVAGAGGFVAVYSGLQSVGDVPIHNPWAGIATSFTDYPDVLVTAGLAIIVLVTITLGNVLDGDDKQNVKIWIDRVASLASMALVGAALYFGASWITFTAVSFVSASALLRLCRTSPVSLKLGGLMLAAGGIGLAGYGLSSLQMTASVLLPGLTIFTGIYVTFASLMTYQGGIYACDGFEDSSPSKPSRASLFHPDGWVGRILGSKLDSVISTLVRVIALPSVFSVPSSIKSTAPFLTSMWTRLPWRLLTGGAAIATGTTVGICSGSPMRSGPLAT